jgi:ATP-binding cassette, subfamily B, bacterial PglK
MISFDYLKKVKTLIGGDVSKLPVILLFFVIISLLEMIGLAFIGPYMATVLGGTSEFSIKYRFIGGMSESEFILILSVALAMVFFFKSVLSVYINKVIMTFCFGTSVKIGSDILASIDKLTFENFTKKSSSEYIQLIRQQSENFSLATLQSFLKLTSEMIVVTVIITFLIISFGKMIAIVIGFIILMMSFYYFIFKTTLERLSKTINTESERMIKSVSESLNGYVENKILNNGKYFINTFEKSAKKYARSYVNSQMITTSPRFFIEFIMVLVITISVITYGESLIGDKAIPMFAVLGMAGIRLLPSLNVIMSSLSQIKHGQHGVDLLSNEINLLNRRVKYKESHAFEFIKENNIVFDGVTYSFPNKEVKILNNINLKIKQGEFVAIVGPSGSGKSTLMNLLIGLLDPTAGSIKINNYKVKDIRNAWWDSIALIPQRVHIINASIKNNIALGVEENDIDNIMLLRAIKMSNMQDVILQLEDGVDTVLGEYGLNMSGGQIQRIAIARAFYFNRSILFLDEATSSLDDQTEDNIMNELLKYKGSITVVLITHRFKILKFFDHTYRLQDGSVNEI